MTEYKIYTLTCPLDGQVKYVGKTYSANLKTRLDNHYSGCEGTLKKLLWIEKLRTENVRPIIEVVETINTDSKKVIDETESYWINQFKQWGFNLVNGTHYAQNKRKYISPSEYALLREKEYNNYQIEINLLTKHADRK